MVQNSFLLFLFQFCINFVIWFALIGASKNLKFFQKLLVCRRFAFFFSNCWQITKNYISHCIVHSKLKPNYHHPRGALNSNILCAFLPWTQSNYFSTLYFLFCPLYTIRLSLYKLTNTRTFFLFCANNTAYTRR